MTRADKASTGLFAWIRVGSGTHVQHEDDTGPGALWRTLRRDPVGLATLAALAALAGLAAAASFVAALESAARIGAMLRPGFAFVAIGAGISRLSRGWQRRLWIEVAAAIACWGLARAALALAQPRTLTLAVAAGALLAAAYVTLLAAVERAIRRRGEVADAVGAAVFVLGLYFYFVVIPAAVDPAVDVVYRQLFYMLLVLDLYVIGRLVYCGVMARSMRWRMFYSLFLLMTAGVFVSDAIACLRVAGIAPEAAAGIYDLFWNVPLVFLVLAARLRRHAFAVAERRDEPEERATPRSREHLAALALLFPFIHLLLHGVGLLGSASEPLRDAFMSIWLLAFGAIALGQQRRLEDQVRRLGAERLRAADELELHEESRRRDQERRDAETTPQISEEKLFKAWRSIPDAMLISTVAEGHILEVNDGFLRQFGYQRGEVIGKTGVELRLWVEPEDRAMMTRLLRERGAVRNLAFELSPKSGEKRLTLLSGEIVDLEGKACFVMVLRDVTELKSLELASS